MVHQLVTPQCKIVNNIPFYKKSNHLKHQSDHIQQQLLG